MDSNSTLAFNNIEFLILVKPTPTKNAKIKADITSKKGEMAIEK